MDGSLTDVLTAGDLPDWRVLDGRPSAWFEATSQFAAATLAKRLASTVDQPLDVDLRPGGVLVSISESASDQLGAARAVSRAALDLGLPADPSPLHRLRLILKAAEPVAAERFWGAVLGYQPTGDGLADPGQRDPAVSIERREAPSPLRNRLHIDVVRPPEAVAGVRAAVGQTGSGPFGVRLADPDGNEVDLVPGDTLPEGPETSDWRVLFSAMARYRAESPAVAAPFVVAVARLADDAGVPLLIDLRGAVVTIDSGKDRWEDGFQPAGTTFADLAAQIQTAARTHGLAPEPDDLRFLQVGVDAADVPAVQGFWRAVLRCERDIRPGLTEIFDPRWLAPVLLFQKIDPDDPARRAQAPRIVLEIAVPADRAQERVDAAVSAGGRLVAGQAARRRTVLDPEGNALVIVG